MEPTCCPAISTKPHAALGVCTAFFALFAIAGTWDDYGFVIDEATYFWVADEVRQWFNDLPEIGWRQSLSSDGIAQRWHFLEDPAARPANRHSNFNLPAAQHLINVGFALGSVLLDWPHAYRLATAILFSITLAMASLLAARRLGIVGGVYAAAAIVLTPRVFGHAHLACTETPLSCFWTLALCALLNATDAPTSGRRLCWTGAFGVFVGLTMATKLTGWIVVTPVFVWIVCLRSPHWKTLILAMIVLPPLIVVGTTPNLWYDPLGKILDYLHSAANSPWKIPTLYVGTVYRDRLPWHSAPVLVSVTTPLSILALSIIGAGKAFRDRAASLFSLNAAALLGARCLGIVPQHDGERQFLPYFYFAGILAAIGLAAVNARVAQLVRPNGLTAWRVAPRIALAIAVALLALLEPFWECWSYRDHALSYYNRLIDGLPGAERLGFEVSYWFEAMTRDSWESVAERLPPDSRVFVHPDHPGIGELRHAGWLRTDIVATGPDQADFWLLYGRRAAYYVQDPQSGELMPTDLLMTFDRAAALAEKRFMGVRFWALVRAMPSTEWPNARRR